MHLDKCYSKGNIVDEKETVKNIELPKEREIVYLLCGLRENLFGDDNRNDNEEYRKGTTTITNVQYMIYIFILNQKPQMALFTKYSSMQNRFQKRFPFYDLLQFNAIHCFFYYNWNPHTTFMFFPKTHLQDYASLIILPRSV